MEKPVYTIETSKGNHSFTTDAPHSQYNSIDAWLKAHEPSIELLRTAAEIYGIYMTHHGKRSKLR
jgi:hypothetical protein